ncbi:MAG: hypothetical protein ACWGQW_02340 [bacterium]
MDHTHHNLQLHERVEVTYPVYLDVTKPNDPILKTEWLLAEHQALPDEGEPYIWCLDCEREVDPQELGMERVNFY